VFEAHCNRRYLSVIRKLTRRFSAFPAAVLLSAIG
jgi:hypothetical protein